MEVIIAVSTLLMFLSVFLLMRKIDHSLATSQKKEAREEPLSTGHETVLILGNSSHAYKLKELLSEKKIEYKQIEESSQYDFDSNYIGLFAVSDNDFENMMVSIMAERSMKPCKKIAICNCADHLKVFQRNQIRCLFGADISEDNLYQAIFPDRKEKPS